MKKIVNACLIAHMFIALLAFLAYQIGEAPWLFDTDKVAHTACDRCDYIGHNEPVITLTHQELYLIRLEYTKLQYETDVKIHALVLTKMINESDMASLKAKKKAFERNKFWNPHYLKPSKPNHPKRKSTMHVACFMKKYCVK
jgi:hypothetical protein